MVDEKECIFCKIIKGEIPTKKVYADDKFIGILDISPRAEGHTLLIPKDHFSDLLSTPASLAGEMQDAIKNICFDLVKKGKAEGFNFIINNGEVAGQVVHHLHVHIIPRKKDDGLKILV